MDEDRAEDNHSEDSSRAIIPAVASQVVEFYEDVITLIEGPDGQVYVPLRPLAAFLGVDWASQYARTKRDEILSAEIRTLRLDRTGTTGGAPEVIGLPLDFLNGWLFKIEVSRVRPEVRGKILRYQRECYRALARAFQADIHPVAPPSAMTSQLAQIRDLGYAMAHMAEEQMALETRVQEHDQRLDRAAAVVQDLRRRLGRVEERLDPNQYITDEQQAGILNAVKALALLMTGFDPGKNHFQGVYIELHRRWHVPDYKHIRQGDFLAVMAFLEEWHQVALGGRTTPPGGMREENS